MNLKIAYIKIFNFLLLNSTWYLNINDDVRVAQLSAHRHYWKYGWREGRLSHTTKRIKLLLSDDYINSEIDINYPDKNLILSNLNDLKMKQVFKLSLNLDKIFYQ